MKAEFLQNFKLGDASLPKEAVDAILAENARDVEAVAEFARLMGVELDPRTRLNPAYTIDYPASSPDSETGDYYSIRQELQWIAAAHGGNWIITGEGRLLLVPLLSMPEETGYLVTEYGDAITLGGVKLLV